MIEVMNLKKQYGSHMAVDGVSFEAKQREILVLLGPNSADKTTTMRV